jgi:hypothetical protein
LHALAKSFLILSSFSFARASFSSISATEIFGFYTDFFAPFGEANA